jgi:hypothetical protein
MTATKLRPFPMADVFKPGDPVQINTPDNPFADGKVATVTAVHGWGCELATDFATGHFAASFDELKRIIARRPSSDVQTAKVARESGYTGNACDKCGSVRVKRTGPCVVCEDCGENSGCS